MAFAILLSSYQNAKRTRLKVDINNITKVLGRNLCAVCCVAVFFLRLDNDMQINFDGIQMVDSHLESVVRCVYVLFCNLVQKKKIAIKKGIFFFHLSRI